MTPTRSQSELGADLTPPCLQYPGGGGNVGSGVPHDYHQQQQQEENLRRSFSDIFLGGDEQHPPGPPGPPLQQHHLPPNPYAMPPNYCEYMFIIICGN